jgi:thiamine-phosphate pyrophosphorylase
MTRRQSVPGQWLIIVGKPGPQQWKALAKLPRGSGVILLQPLHAKDRLRLRWGATVGDLALAFERPRVMARVHNQRELTQALLRRSRLILISPIHATLSHPAWKPLPRMRAATLARLASRQAVALGGMDRQRYAKVAPLGFIGWAGISAFRT